MHRRPLFWHLFPSYVIVILVSIIAVTWFIVAEMKDFYLAQNAHELEARANLVSSQLSGVNLETDTTLVDSLCKSLGNKSATRITVILPSGKVIGDANENPVKMENHAHRPEIQDALTGRVGVATRYSHTLFETMMYTAIPVKQDGRIIGVVRTSFPVTDIDHAFASVYNKIIIGGIIIAILAVGFSWFISRRITKPLVRMKLVAEGLKRGDFSRHLPGGSTEEINELALAMNEMAVQLDEKIRTTVDQRNEREAILSSMVEGVIAIDNKEHVISINRTAGGMLGIEPQQVEGRYLQESIRNIDLQQFARGILESGAQQEEEIQFLDDQPRFMQLHGAPIQNDRDQKLGAVIVMHDITRLHRLETIRRDFVANVSHELRTPITSIKGFVETLQDGAINNPDDAKRFLEIISRQSDRLNSIINDLLTLSELEQRGRAELQFEPSSVKELLIEAIDVCQPKAKKQNISLNLQCDEKLEVTANGPLLEQAIINLIDNAIKYSNLNSNIDISGTKSDNRIIISVKDYGCGIEKAHLSRLFERFYRVDRARSRELGGTGLGLSIVKHIVLTHSGEVSVESTPGKGSTFYISLPA
jgi:two-component system, OmpR family, phosphate regulon sensor histidine kinase PhoR